MRKRIGFVKIVRMTNIIDAYVEIEFALSVVGWIKDFILSIYFCTIRTTIKTVILFYDLLIIIGENVMLENKGKLIMREANTK